MSPINPDRWVYNTDELIRYLVSSPHAATMDYITATRSGDETIRYAINPPWCGHISNCTNVMKRECMKGLLTKLGATTATSPLSNDLRRKLRMSLHDAWLSVPETREVNATSPIELFRGVT